MPDSVWVVLRLVTLAGLVAVATLAAVTPVLGAVLFWQVIVPSLPLLFVLAPGVWRNVCPLGFVNQLPRIYGLSLGWSLSNRLREHAFLLATGAFVVLILLRKPLLNDSGPALAVMLGTAAFLALIGGLVFKGKSGWCGTFCPLAPIQTVYGHAPIRLVQNRYCMPCLGCQKNCYDFNPRAKMLRDLSDANEEYKGHRKLFVGLLPGLIWSYFNGPDPRDVEALWYVLGTLQGPALSLAAFHVVHYVLALPLFRTVQLFSLGAFLLFYYFAIPFMLDGVRLLFSMLTGSVSPATVSSGRPFTVLLSTFATANSVSTVPMVGPILWIATLPLTSVRSLSAIQLADASALVAIAACSALAFLNGRRLQQMFLARVSRSNASQVAGGAEALQRFLVAKPASSQVLERSSNRQVSVAPGQPLLDALEAAKLPIQSGCRLGICGADPVLLVDGGQHLEPAGKEESETLRRLGLEGRARLACMCRPTGPMTIDLDLSKAAEISPASHGSAPAKAEATGPRYVVVGNGVAGVTFIEHLRREQPDARIALVTREPHHFYNRMGIERVIYGRTVMSGLYLADDKWFESRNIELWLNTIATSIDRSERQLVLATGERLAYDKLVLATGVRATIPQIPGHQMPGCFVMREAEDAIRVRAWIQARRCRSAVILGGGVLGVELADALRRAGLAVTIVHSGPRLMDRQLDDVAGGLLATHLSKSGIAVSTGTSVAALHGDAEVAAAELKDGRTLSCQLFVACIGVTPNIELAQQAGLKTARGVIVDRAMSTEDPDILCLGDAAESPAGPSGLWSVAVHHAKAAVAGLIGRSASIDNAPAPVRLKLEGIDVRSVGTIQGNIDNEVLTASDPARGSCGRLVLRDGVILGCAFVNDGVSAQAGIELMAQGRNLAPILPELRRGEWASLRKALQPSSPEQQAVA